MQPVHWILIVALVIGVWINTVASGQTPGATEKYATAVAPEILGQFDPRVVAGVTPIIVTISRPMIGLLNDDPDL
jgi:hypothetical protein